jgi:glycosyltransferase involved in cell wall biosynthesis
MPAVSVIIPSYNHERYIGESIQSVLSQQYQDFEIVITDDGSSDRTVEVIEGFRDPRIKIFRHSRNLGASVAANNCILQSSGKYIAMLSSDDAWYPEKLQLQVDYLETHPPIAAVFGKVDWVDKNGRPILYKRFPALDVFDVHNRPRYEWLNYFFYRGNCLCHPTSLIRRACYTEVGMFNPALASLPDFDLWIRICFKYDIAVLDRKLIRFRRINDERNASGDTDENRVRNRFEYRQILNHYLEITNPEEFSSIFPEAGKFGKPAGEGIPYLLGRIAVDTGVDFKVLWGLDLILSQIQNESIAQFLLDNYNFSHRDFIGLTGRYNIFGIPNIRPNGMPGIFSRSALERLISSSKRYAKEIYSIISGS